MADPLEDPPSGPQRYENLRKHAALVRHDLAVIKYSVGAASDEGAVSDESRCPHT